MNASLSRQPSPARAILAGAALAAILAVPASHGSAAPVSLQLNPGDSITFDTTNLTYSGAASGSGIVYQGMPMFFFGDVNLPSGATVNLTGNQPLMVVSLQGITVGTTLDGSATGQTGRLGAGNGGNAGAPAQNGTGPLGNIGGGIRAMDGGGGCCFGGGGGSYGGRGGSQTAGSFVGLSGQTYGDVAVSTLLAGSGGAGGGNCCAPNYGTPIGGGGGGAIGLSALGNLTLLPTAKILMDGADGNPSTTNRTGGGGSGGAIRLTGDSVQLASGAILSASGGDSLPLNQNRTGGAGGGGRVAILGRSIANSATVSAAGGAANNPDGAAPGSEAGDPGTIFSTTAFPLYQFQYAANVLADRPIAYYRLNETSGAVAVDAIGPGPNGNRPGTYVGNPQLGQLGPGPVQGFFGIEENNAATLLDGSGDGIQMTGASAIPYGGGDYSIELWFQAAYADITSRDLFAGTAGGNHGTLLELSASGANRQLRFLHRSPAGGSGGQNIFFTLPGAGDPFYDSFHHLVAVKDDVANGMQLYLDGALVGQTTASGVFSGALDVAIGRIAVNNSARDFKGYLDEVAIYDHALSGADVARHYRAAFVPEPGSLGLAALGLLALLGVAWRRGRSGSPA